MEARTGKYKLGAPIGGQGQVQRPSKGPWAGKYKYPISYVTVAFYLKKKSTIESAIKRQFLKKMANFKEEELQNYK